MRNLTLLLAMPFVFACLAFVLPSLSSRAYKRLALAGSLFPLLFLVCQHAEFPKESIDLLWIPALNVHFHVHLDELAYLFCLLTSLVVSVSIIAAREGMPYASIFYGLVFLLEGLLFGFFAAQDLALFTFFWESMLIPLYFIITLWGGVDRQKAALKFLIYMIAGSCLMVAAVLFLFFTSSAHTFSMALLAKEASASPFAALSCAIFLLAFAVKTPLFPFHAWLPDAYEQAPTSGTILLSAILSKAGVFGVIRIGWAFFPSLLVSWSPIFLGLAVTGVLYGALAAWRQNDFKRLIAYSSFSHINFIWVGLFVASDIAHQGAVLQAINHGITIAGLFLVAGWLEARLSTTLIGKYHGLAKYLPLFCWMTLCFVLASVALPGTNNFVGELLIFYGLFLQNPWLAALLGTSLIFSVVYMLRWMQKMFFEHPSPFLPQWHDLRKTEIAAVLPLLVLIVWIGLYPSPLLEHIQISLSDFPSLPFIQET